MTAMPLFQNPGPVSKSQAVHDRQWLAGLSKVHAFVVDTKRRPTRHENEDGEHFEEGHLSKWLAVQRKTHREGRLPAWRVEALNTVCPDWNALRSATPTWEVTLERVLAHRAEHGVLPSPTSKDKDEAALGRWVQARLSDWLGVTHISTGRILGRIHDIDQMSEDERHWFGAAVNVVRFCEELGGLEGLENRVLDPREYVYLGGSDMPTRHEELRPILFAWLAKQQTAHLSSLQVQTLNYRLPSWRTAGAS